MHASAHQPAGFCPTCGYAIDPGVCSECGTNVPAHRLLRESPAARRRRRVRRGLLAVAVLAALGGGLYAYRGVNWPRYSPTAVLLLLQGDESSRATCELVRRYEDGELTDAQAARMFDRSAEARLHVLDRAPEGMKLPMRLEFKVRLSPSGSIMNWPSTAGPALLSEFFGPIAMQKWQILIDDDLISESSPSPAELPPAGWRLRTPDLRSGVHKVTIRATFTLFNADGMRPANAVHTWQLERSRSVLIEDRPLAEFSALGPDVSLIPTELLVFPSERLSRHAIYELWNRYEAGELKTAQVTRMFNDAVMPSLDVRSPYPAGVRMLVAAVFDAALPDRAVAIQRCEFFVDGRPVKAGPDRWLINDKGPRDRVVLSIPPLLAGPHELKAVLTAASKGIAPWTASAVTRIVVEDRPAEEYVTRLTSREALKRGAEARVFGVAPPEYMRIYADDDDLGALIMGQLYARSAGDETYTHLGDICSLRWLGPAAIDLSGVPGIESAEQVDLRIEPDARVAVTYGVKSFYGGVIERLGVPVGRPDAGQDE